MIAGRPFLKNIVLKTFTVCVDVVVVIYTSLATLSENIPLSSTWLLRRVQQNLCELFLKALLAIPMHSVVLPLVRFDSVDIFDIS